MATTYALNYTAAFVTTPPVKIHQGEYGGKERVMIDKRTLAGDATAGDVLVFGRLPAGAKVISARIFGPDLGGTGTVELGNSASIDASGDDSADADSFIDAADVSGQAFDVSDNASATMRGPAIGLIRFTKEVNVQAVLPTTSGATAAVITCIVKYILD